MESVLNEVYFTEYCNVCGESYPVTLYEVAAEQQLDQEWHHARPCECCSQARSRLVAAVPRAELAALLRASEQIEAAAEDPAARADAVAAATDAWNRLAGQLRARGLAFAVEQATA